MEARRLAGYLDGLEERLYYLVAVEQRPDTDPLVAALRLHLRKQQAYIEYLKTAGDLLGADANWWPERMPIHQADKENVLLNGHNAPDINQYGGGGHCKSATFESLHRQMLRHSFQGCNLHYSNAHPVPKSSDCLVGPSL